MHIRTAAYSEPARECDDSPVAFEVDDLDEAERSGWSVLMRGRAHLDFAAPAGDARPRGLGGRATRPCGYGSRSRRSRVGRIHHGRLSALRAGGCLVAKIAAWVRLVSPSLASIEET